MSHLVAKALCCRVARQPANAAPDWTLFAIQLANAGYFVHNALTAGNLEDGKTAIVPASLGLLVVAVAAGALTAHGLACGVIGATPAKGAADVTRSRSRARDIAGHRGTSRARSMSPAAAWAGRGEGQKDLTGSIGWLDRLQRDAQQKELEPATTAPAVFLALAAAQTVVIALVAHYALPGQAVVDVFGLITLKRFEMAALLSLSSHWAGFVISIIIRSDKWFDVTEDIAYFAIFVWAYRSIEPAPLSLRQQLAFGLAMIWCIRLLAFLGYRVIVRGRDFRFDKLIQVESCLERPPRSPRHCRGP